MPATEQYLAQKLANPQDELHSGTERENLNTLEASLSELVFEYAGMSTVITQAPSNEVQHQVADFATKNLVLIRDSYPYLRNQYNAIRLVCAAQLAHPDNPIAKWFYKGIESEVMKYVARGDGAHTTFMGLLMNDYLTNDAVISHFAEAFAATPQEKRALTTGVFPQVVHAENLYHVLWEMSHAVFPIIGVDESLFSSWVSRPIKRNNEILIAKNLKQLIRLHSIHDMLPDSVQNHLGIRQFGKFDFDTLVTAHAESQSQLTRDHMITFLSSFRDKDLPVYETEYMSRELNRHKSLKNTGLLAYEIEGPTQLHDALVATLQKATKQAVIILKGHSQKEQFSDIPTELLFNAFADVRSQTSIPILLILAACHVGKRSGAAQELSKAGIQVISSNEKSHISNIKLLARGNNSINAKVSYSRGQTVVYKNGHEIDRY